MFRAYIRRIGWHVNIYYFIYCSYSCSIASDGDSVPSSPLSLDMQDGKFFHSSDLSIEIDKIQISQMYSSF